MNKWLKWFPHIQAGCSEKVSDMEKERNYWESEIERNIFFKRIILEALTEVGHCGWTVELTRIKRTSLYNKVDTGDLNV